MPTMDTRAFHTPTECSVSRSSTNLHTSIWDISSISFLKNFNSMKESNTPLSYVCQTENK